MSTLGLVRSNLVVSATKSNRPCKQRVGGSRLSTVRVNALFGSGKDKSDAAERRKEEQWRVQQELLAERRAKRERLDQAFGRKAAKGSAAAAEKPSAKAAPSPVPKKAQREQVVVVEEEEDEAPAPAAGGNPLAGLLGSFFGKK